jgi:hypothetical protein
MIGEESLAAKGFVMKRLALGCALASLTLVAIVSIAPPARADFYTLDGRFQCLDHANAVCGDAKPLASMQPVAKPAPLPQPASASVAVMPAPVAHVAPAMPPADDPLHEIAARVQTGKPASGDLVWLKQAADKGNARAIELLAWCALNAIGMPADPVRAYLLYGAAADAAVPRAHENQALIYERDLDPNQRQQILNLANEGVALAQLAPAAR